MAFNILTYKSVRSMIEDLESQMRFSPKLIRRCYKEAFFEDLESLLKRQKIEVSHSFNEALPFKSVTVNNKESLSTTESNNGWFLKTMRIAASITLLILASVSIVIVTNSNTIETSVGESKSIVLPDGSKVTLNASSEISYNDILWQLNRSLNLEGEALFHVEKGDKFTVNTSQGSVKVLGTVFNVRQRNQGFDVRCESGRVEVNKEETSIVLTKGENVKWQPESSSLVKYEIKAPSIASWNDGLFYFDNEPLSQVVAEIERQFGINVILKTDRQYYFSGYFSNNSLDTSIQTVCTALGLDFSFQKNGNFDEVIIE